jgi:hypothetical protein
LGQYSDLLPPKACPAWFTSNHDENSWNGTEFEKYGDAYKMFSVFSMTYNQTIPLVYSGQEIPNKKRLKFFVKDPIEWNGLEMESFYKTLLHQRKMNPSFASDASYRRIKTSADENVLCFMREKNKHKSLTIMNLSSKPQSIIIQDKNFSGNVVNIFDGSQSITLKAGQKFQLEPWGFLVFSDGANHTD